MKTGSVKKSSLSNYNSPFAIHNQMECDVMIVVVGKAQVKPEAHEAVVAACLEMSALSEAEMGCISYQFYESLAEAHAFLLFEEWETAEALQNHFKQPHTMKFGSKLANYLASEMSVKRYDILSVNDL
jgi:quinol monooxygenase YgiN